MDFQQKASLRIEMIRRLFYALSEVTLYHICQVISMEIKKYLKTPQRKIAHYYNNPARINLKQSGFYSMIKEDIIYRNRVVLWI